MAILPKQTQIGDEIILKGRIKDDAQMWVYILIIAQTIDANDDRLSGFYNKPFFCLWIRNPLCKHMIKEVYSNRVNSIKRDSSPWIERKHEKKKEKFKVCDHQRTIANVILNTFWLMENTSVDDCFMDVVWLCDIIATTN